MAWDEPCKRNCKPFSGDDPAGGLYLHVPFCRAKCRYCDFYSIPIDESLVGAYADAVKSELEMNLPDLARPLVSAFLGGGTPTVLGRRIAPLLALVRPLTDANTEFSVEANPGTLDAEQAGILAAGGVNRVSLGAQSFHDDELRLLGRVHDAAGARRGVATLRAAGIANIGLDLIYGIPGSNMDRWRQSVAAGLELGIDHLSCYALSIEQGTPLWQDRLEGRLSEMDDDLQRECYYATIELARQAGMEHYEISNFARPGRRCRHNMLYWNNLSYIGLGPAAASYARGVRRTNKPDLAAYLADIGNSVQPTAFAESLQGRPKMAETLMLGLRLIEGVEVAQFAARFGQTPQEAFPRSINRHKQLGMLVEDAGRLRLSERALFVSDSVLADIVEEGRIP